METLGYIFQGPLRRGTIVSTKNTKMVYRAQVQNRSYQSCQYGGAVTWNTFSTFIVVLV